MSDDISETASSEEAWSSDNCLVSGEGGAGGGGRGFSKGVLRDGEGERDVVERRLFRGACVGISKLGQEGEAESAWDWVWMNAYCASAYSTHF